MDEAELIGAAKAGDRRAFDELVRRSFVDTFTLARRLTALPPDLLVEARAVPLANGIAALLPGFADRHLAARLTVLLLFYRLVRHTETLRNMRYALVVPKAAVPKLA